MSEHAVVVGVNKTGGLPPLSAAVSGACDFADWARDQGLSVKLITDDDGHDVTVSELQDAIDEILARRNCRKLVVYFAGHGFLLGANLELWLLSKAPARSQEAVNVRLSMDQARYSSIEHVLFVSDACRSGGPTHQHRSVVGAPIFSTPTTFDFDGNVDVFYATRPGDAAHEYATEAEAVSNYKGLFTECLLHALRGNVAHLVTDYDANGTTRHLILSHDLDDHLKTVVPLQAEEISIKLSQKPIAIAESRPPQYFGEVDEVPSVRRGNGRPEAMPPEPGVRELVAAAQDDVLAMRSDDALSGQPTSAEQAEFKDQFDRVVHSRGRDHFETTTGFTVYGDIERATIARGWRAEVFEEDDVMQIRIEPPDPEGACSMLAEFRGGYGTVLAVKPGFIGSVVVEADQVVSVTYTPSSNTGLYAEEYEPMAERIEQRRAFAATAMRHGVFELRGDDAGNAGEYLRMMKRLDPTLGLYASYAYQQAGKLERIRSVARYMEQDGIVLYDVLLLARHPEPWPRYAPFCPMLRQGWALLELHPPALQRLASFRTELKPSLWTVFTADGCARIREGLEQGVIQ